MNRLEGKTAFVTGAGGGIGRAICAMFLAEGGRVAAADVDHLAAKSAVASCMGSRQAIAIECDAGDAQSVQSAIGLAVDAFGSLNVLSHVAGGSSTSDGRVTEAPEEEFWRVMRLDLFGTFLVAKYGLPELIRAGGGSVINLTSVLGIIGVPGRDCYSAAKGGVSALTRSMAAGYAQNAIRVNAIAPGVTTTPRVMSRYESSDSMKKFGSRHLMGLVPPEDVASMAVFLASDESRTVTGQILQVDSGVTIH